MTDASPRCGCGMFGFPAQEHAESCPSREERTEDSEAVQAEQFEQRSRELNATVEGKIDELRNSAGVAAATRTQLEATPSNEGTPQEDRERRWTIYKSESGDYKALPGLTDAEEPLRALYGEAVEVCPASDLHHAQAREERLREALEKIATGEVVQEQMGNGPYHRLLSEAEIARAALSENPKATGSNPPHQEHAGEDQP